MKNPAWLAGFFEKIVESLLINDYCFFVTVHLENWDFTTVIGNIKGTVNVWSQRAVE